SQAMPARSPGRQPSTPSPSATTSPTTSWPGTTPGRFGGRSPSARWRSVRHTPLAVTRTSSSPAAGSGTGRRTARSGPDAIGPGVATSHASIVRLVTRPLSDAATAATPGHTAHPPAWAAGGTVGRIRPLPSGGPDGRGGHGLSAPAVPPPPAGVHTARCRRGRPTAQGRTAPPHGPNVRGGRNGRNGRWRDRRAAQVGWSSASPTTAATVAPARAAGRRSLTTRVPRIRGEQDAGLATGAARGPVRAAGRLVPYRLTRGRGKLPMCRRVRPRMLGPRPVRGPAPRRDDERHDDRATAAAGSALVAGSGSGDRGGAGHAAAHRGRVPGREPDRRRPLRATALLRIGRQPGGERRRYRRRRFGRRRGRVRIRQWPD